MTIIAGTLDALIPMLRLKMGDTDITSYRYLDSWLKIALQASIKTLARFWDSKYILDANSEVIRNTSSASYANFEFTEPQIIQFKDEWLIVLMAAIIIKSGTLESIAWDLGSWRDAELSFSNIASGDKKDASLSRDWQEFYSYLKPPVKRLVIPIRTAFTEPS